MKITVFGAGYIGLVTAAGLAEIGHTVKCIDVDAQKLAKLNKCESIFYEPGLEELLSRNIPSGRLSFTASDEEAIRHGEIVFIAVGTPARLDGSADLNAVFQAAASIGRNLASHHKVVVIKSTVPVGTSRQVTQVIRHELDLRGVDFEFNVVSNPEFLKEGTAVENFMKPDRIVVGAENQKAFETIRALYSPFERRENIIFEMDSASAELTKYAANALLASRISLMNELSNLAELLGADIEQVRRGVGADPRIGSSFLYAGCGYGGSCFPKDLNALINMGENLGLEAQIIKSIEAVNEAQKTLLFRKINSYFGEQLANKIVAVWGLSFKPDTDDMRCAPSIPLVIDLHKAGAIINVYDPVAITNAKEQFSDLENIVYHDDKYASLSGSDALVLVTEWKEFRAPDFTRIYDALRAPVIFDGRNQWDTAEMQSRGFEYYSIGRSNLISHKLKYGDARFDEL